MKNDEFNESQNEKIYGLYDFHSTPLINPLIHDIGGDVVRHEHTHHIISVFSSMGLLLTMIQKASILAPEKKWLYQALLETMQYVQEVIATNVEYFTIWQDKGKQAYDKAIILLHNNKEYYRYFDQLHDIHKNINSDNVTEFIMSLYYIAIFSFNVDFFEFPVWKFENSEGFRAFLNKPKNREKFNPKARFKTIVNYTLRSNTEYLNKYKLVEDATVKEDITEHCRSIAMLIYKDSPYFDKICLRINHISVKKTEIYEGNNVANLQSFPINLSSNIANVNYYLCDIKEAIDSLNKNPNMYILFEHLLGGLEEFAFFVCLNPLDLEHLAICQYDTNSVQHILNDVPNAIVFTQSKLYKLKKHLLNKYKQPIYIIMDTAISNNLDFIFGEFEGGKYTYFISNQHLVLLVFNQYTVLIQPLILEAKQEFPYIFAQKNIEYIDYSVSGYYNDHATQELADISFKLASDGRKRLEEG